MKRLLVYLADPVHNFITSRDNWFIPLGVLNIAAYLKEKLDDQVEIRVFKFPDEIFKAIQEKKPDIIGVSNYLWNFELSKNILQYAKEFNPHTITVMGGPNATQTEKAMTILLKEIGCDFYISGDGEHPFMCLVNALLKSEGEKTTIFQDEKTHSLWQLDPMSEIAVHKPNKHTIKNLDEIPSPFLNGMVDKFFKVGLWPILETNRGCPFACTYCVWGNKSKIYHYSVSRIKSDIDYCRTHVQDGFLMLADANFGLFGTRDMEIAEFLKYSNDNYDWPSTVVVNWGQVESKKALSIADTLKNICVLRQSSQSMNPLVLRNINRKNISDNQWHKVVKFCDEHGIDSFGELILMLPEETMDSYMDALRYLFELDVNCINTNQLQLLSGAKINTTQERKKYQMETKWRLLENAYGIYHGRVAIEAEELVSKTSTFAEAESLTCRCLNWLIQMSWTLCSHDLLLYLLKCVGINPADFLIAAVLNVEKAPPSVQELFKSFNEDAKTELFSTKKELVQQYSSQEQLNFLSKGGFKKLNTHYSGRVLDCSKDFIDYYLILALDLTAQLDNIPKDYNNIIEECCLFLQNRNLRGRDLEKIEIGEEINREAIFHYDFLKCMNEKKNINLEKIKFVEQGIKFRFLITQKQKKRLVSHMQKFSGISREYQLRKLHEPYYGINRNDLYLTVE